MKLAIIGAGMIVKDFLTIVPKLKDLELTAIYGRESNKDNLNELKNRYGIMEVFYDYNELLSSEIDTVYIALPNNLHFEFSRKALEANKNVIIEKPMTSNYEETLIINNLAREKKVVYF